MFQQAVGTVKWFQQKPEKNEIWFQQVPTEKQRSNTDTKT
jgi:hypothetical protein